MSYEESNVLPAANNKNIEHQYLSEFFVIDSDNLDSVKTALYGYCILNDGFITSKTRESDFTPTGVGVYVWVRDETVNGIIRIEQDFNGSFGLYIFQADGYFALSNSFVLLLDHIKKRYPISLNKDFFNY